MVIKAFNGKCNDADSSIKGSNPGARKLITRGRVAGVNRRRGTRIVAGFCLPRDHGVRFPDCAAFVTSSFQAFVGVSPKAPLASALSPYASVFWRRSESTAFERAPANGWHFRQYIARGRRRVSGPPAKQAPPIRKSRSQTGGGTPTTSPTDSSCQSSQRRHRFYRLERPKMCLIQCHGACWMTFVAPLPPSER